MKNKIPFPPGTLVYWHCRWNTDLAFDEISVGLVKGSKKFNMPGANDNQKYFYRIQWSKPELLEFVPRTWWEGDEISPVEKDTVKQWRVRKSRSKWRNKNREHKRK